MNDLTMIAVFLGCFVATVGLVALCARLGPARPAANADAQPLSPRSEVSP